MDIQTQNDRRRRNGTAMTGADSHAWKSRSTTEFDRWAHTYDQSVLNRIIFQRCYLKFIELIVRSGKIDAQECLLLDIGCGTGTFVSMLAETELPIRPIGLDMAQAMCRIAAAKIRQVGLESKVRFVSADSEHLPFADNTFDFVTCSNSFHHYPHQLTVVQQMHRVLKPGGMLFILDGFRDNVIGWFVFDVCVALAERAVHHCAASEIRAMLRQAGFADILQEKFGFWAPVLATAATKRQDTES